MAKTSQVGIDLIKSFESFQGKAYLDPAGKPTIGWGTTFIYDNPVKLGMEINELVGELFLAHDLHFAECVVRNVIDMTLNQNQFDALVSFQYNTGGLETSTLLKHINTLKPVTEDLFTRWNKARINGKLTVLRGLTKRRKAEFALYESPCSDS